MSCLTHYDREALADVLGVCPLTLPVSQKDRALSQPSKHTFIPMSDAEWVVVSSTLPALPIPKPGADFKDRTFIDSVLWWIEAKARGYSWHRLPPELGPTSSREHRHRRWVMLDYWSAIHSKLAAAELLSEKRLSAFRCIAEDAARRKALLLERRARLTDAGRRAA